MSKKYRFATSTYNKNISMDSCCVKQEVFVNVLSCVSNTSLSELLPSKKYMPKIALVFKSIAIIGACCRFLKSNT